MRSAIGRAWLRSFRWSIDGGPPADVTKAVVVAAPHTSNWDLPFSLALAWSLDVEMRWLGKHTLFEVPIWGDVLRRLGGIPVDRRNRIHAVQAIAEVFQQHDRLLLLVPPEGTRSAARRWKTGFYWIAVEAKVPIILGFLDFGRKRCGLGEVFWPSGDIHADFEKLRAFYRDIQGKRPTLQGEVSIGEPDEAPRPASAAA